MNLGIAPEDVILQSEGIQRLLGLPLSLEAGQSLHGFQRYFLPDESQASLPLLRCASDLASPILRDVSLLRLCRLLAVHCRSQYMRSEERRVGKGWTEWRV